MHGSLSGRPVHHDLKLCQLLVLDSNIFNQLAKLGLILATIYTYVAIPL